MKQKSDSKEPANKALERLKQFSESHGLPVKKAKSDKPKEEKSKPKKNGTKK